MKKICLFIICLPILVLGQPNNECYRSSNSEFKDSATQIMFNLVNEYRVSHNLNELQWCSTLQKSCLSHSRYMAYDKHCHKETNKRNPYYTGPHCWNRTKFKMCGENVQAGYEFNGVDALPWMKGTIKVKTAKEIANEMFIGWTESPEHNENMLDKQWNYFAFDYYGYDAEEKYYDCFLATQLFR